jgi:hypothetical protein
LYKKVVNPGLNLGFGVLRFGLRAIFQNIGGAAFFQRFERNHKIKRVPLRFVAHISKIRK